METTTKAKHTPGPWFSPVDTCSPPAPYGVFAANMRTVAMVECDDDEPQEDCEIRANARLIAAAPMLAESLRQLIAEIDPHGNMTDPDLSSHRPVIAARAALRAAGLLD